MVNTDVQMNGSISHPVTEIVLDDDDDVEETSKTLGTLNGGSTNGALNGQSSKTLNGNSVKETSGRENPEIDCIELDDDVVLVDEPPTKKAKSDTVVAKPADKNESELNNYTVLLDRLEEYIKLSLTKKENVDRKLLDALLSAINIQVQKEPYSVRKLILDKQLVLPNTISFPPSQAVDLIIEHDPDVQLSRIITRIFGDERPRLTETEKRERQQLKNAHPAPAMTKMLMEIGQDLVQETTYSDIVHARNLPEMPKNVETYKQVAAQLKPVWENLRDKNEPFKLQLHSCSICGFRTDSLIQISIHKQTLHINSNRKIQCGMCAEHNTNGNRMQRHVLEKHGLKPLMPEEPPAKIQCPICDENFQFKGQRDGHLKVCKRDVVRISTIQASRMPEHSTMINRWLWHRPPIDPTVAAQQQDVHKQQLIKQQQQQQRLVAAAAAAARASTQAQNPNLNAKTAALIAQQQFQSQIKGLGPQQQQQLEGILRNKQANIPQAVLHAVQAQLQKSLQAGTLAAQLNPQMMQQLNRSLQQNQRRSLNAAQAPKQSTPQRKVGGALPASNQSAKPTSSTPVREDHVCEICDEKHRNRVDYLAHLQSAHSLFRGKSAVDLEAGPPLACSRCRDRFWSYDGLERHLVMNHNLVTSDLLIKAQNKSDGGRCKQCSKTFAFNILQHLASDHGARLCSAEIMFSCDVCPFKCSSYQKLESHLSESHPKNVGRTAAR